jgi:hypothetical protein
MFRFLSRLAFICNIFFLFAVLLQTTNWLPQQDITGTVAIIGYFMALIVNPLVNLCYLVLLLLGKKAKIGTKRWLVVANMVFLLLQIIFIFYLNDQKPYRL